MRGTACVLQGYGLGCSGWPRSSWKTSSSTRSNRSSWCRRDPGRRPSAGVVAAGSAAPAMTRVKGRRRWRTLDLGLIRAFLEADAPRVRCPEHGVIAAQVPWARHGAGHTYAFDDTAAWLVTHCSKSAVRDLLRIAWRTVGSIVTRVVADAEATTDRFANLRRIGIDEISYK